MIENIASHRSIRHFKSTPIPSEVMEAALTAATRASTIGGMQLYSIIVSEQAANLKQLAPLHFNQSAATSAAAIVTFCVDVNRFSAWCEMRDAQPSYGNFLWFVNGAIDTLLASQNFALEAQHQGLGICYLGTTLYTAREICAALNLPRGVIPITAIAVGYADEKPPLTPRLPLAAVVHYQSYQQYTAGQLNDIYFDTEHSQFTAQLLVENRLDNLAQIFTQKRYTKVDSEKFSKKYFELLQEQGFLE